MAGQATPQPGTPRLCLELTGCARQPRARGPSMSSGIRRDLCKPEPGLEAPRFTESSSACGFECQNPSSWQSVMLEGPSPSHTKATHFPRLGCRHGGHLIAIVKHSGKEAWGFFPFLGFEFISENIVQNQYLKRNTSLHPRTSGLEKVLVYVTKPSLCKLQQRKSISLHFCSNTCPLRQLRKLSTMRNM